jgi:hypothetical protein
MMWMLWGYFFAAFQHFVHRFVNDMLPGSTNSNPRFSQESERTHLGRGDVYVVNPLAELLEGVSAHQLPTHEVIN